jgi:hypothetical protein
MPDDPFRHDERTFDAAAEPGGVEIREVEARYAALFSELLAEGAIDDDGRAQLAMASRTLGIAPERARRIEEALTMAAQARRQLEADEAAERTSEYDVEPIAQSEDPGVGALQRRIQHLEERTRELARENNTLCEHIDKLESLVGQLQGALESTLEELDAAHRQVAARPSKQDALDRGPASRVTSASQPPPPPSKAAPQSSRAMARQEPPPPQQSLMQMRREGLSAIDLAAEISAELSAPDALVRNKRDNPAELHRLLRENPDDSEVLHQLFDALQRADDVDRRWCIAHTLVFRAEATDRERELHERHRTAGLVRPVRAINDDEWRELLFHPEEDPLIGEIFSAIAPAVLLGQLTNVRASIAPEVLDADKRVDPQTSTLQAVRCFAWASAFLGLKTPPLYVYPDHDAGAEIVLDPQPSTRLGKRAVSGRSSAELAFLAGRHLCWYRPEHLLGRPRRSVRRLEDMFLAALMIGNPGLPINADIKKRVEPIARTIRPLLPGEAVQKLGHCFARFIELGGRTNLSRWLRAVERTAECTGLLLGNDLGAARRMLERDQVEDIDVAVGELVVFFTAGRCSLLRRRIGIAVTV